MNQAIQFPDREEGTRVKNVYVFPPREWYATDMCDLLRVWRIALLEIRQNSG